MIIKVFQHPKERDSHAFADPGGRTEHHLWNSLAKSKLVLNLVKILHPEIQDGSHYLMGSSAAGTHWISLKMK